jgi:aerobic carbon-monoxide dehydrogenase medium subunit
MMFIRRLPWFEYHTPGTLSDALDLLIRYGEKARILAGGTDLLVTMKRRETVPEHLINIKGLIDLKGIARDSGGRITIGPLVTLEEVEHSELVKEKLPGLWDAVRVMASPQIKSLATIGGNICSAMPSADTVPPLISSGASVKIVGIKGEREVPVEAFFKGPGESLLRSEEILTRILLPAASERTGSRYLKLMRRHAMDLAQVGVAVCLSLDSDGLTCRAAGVALGAVAETPIRVSGAEKVLLNKGISPEIAREAGRIASAEANPRSSIRASKEYRKAMIEVLTKRAVLGAFERAVGAGAERAL